MRAAERDPSPPADYCPSPVSTRPSPRAAARCVGAWKADAACTNCEDCDRAFTWFRRRHHCRRCGGIFCGKCSRQTARLPRQGYRTEVRVCDACKAVADLPRPDLHPAGLRWSASSLPSLRTSTSFERTPGHTPDDSTSPGNLSLEHHARGAVPQQDCSAFKQVPTRAPCPNSRLSRSADKLRVSSATFGGEDTGAAESPSPACSTPPFELPRSATAPPATTLPVHFTTRVPIGPGGHACDRGGARQLVLTRRSPQAPIGLSLTGTMVTAVDPGSPAQLGGVEVGMRVLRIAGKVVRSDSEAVDALVRCPTAEVCILVRPAQCAHSAASSDGCPAVVTPTPKRASSFDEMRAAVSQPQIPRQSSGCEAQ